MVVPGLGYEPRFVTAIEGARLIDAVDGEPWLTDLKRRVQHYGYRYDYKARRVDRSMYLGPLPNWAGAAADRLVAEGHMADPPDQLIVNEYAPGQGIAPHVDCVPCFGPVVCSLTLGSACVMQLDAVGGTKATSIPLEPGSLLTLEGDARYIWRHGIPARKTDRHDGRIIPRARRVSLTFRTIRLDD